MATTIRPNVSPKSKYYLTKHRYYELKHFCLQYPEWAKQYAALTGYAETHLSGIQTSGYSDPTEKCMELRLPYAEKMEMVRETAEKADPEFATYLLKAVTEGLSFRHMQEHLGMPCCKEHYYESYRRFFWLLDKKRV